MHESAEVDTLHNGGATVRAARSAGRSASRHPARRGRGPCGVAETARHTSRHGSLWTKPPGWVAASRGAGCCGRGGWVRDSSPNPVALECRNPAQGTVRAATWRCSEALCMCGGSAFAVSVLQLRKAVMVHDEVYGMGGASMQASTGHRTCKRDQAGGVMAGPRACMEGSVCVHAGRCTACVNRLLRALQLQAQCRLHDITDVVESSQRVYRCPCWPVSFDDRVPTAGLVHVTKLLSASVSPWWVHTQGYPTFQYRTSAGTQHARRRQDWSTHGFK